MDILNAEKDISIDRKGVVWTDLRWPAYLLMAVCSLLLAWFFLPIFRSWYTEWMKEESYYSHGILVPFISLFIVWLKRAQLKGTPIKPCALGYVFLIPLLAGVVLTLWAGANIAGGLAFPLVLGSVLLVLLGFSMTRELLFPLGYLYFMCVLPGSFLIMASFRVQMLSTQVATLILKAMTFDAERTGALISLPNIEVMVGAPCSGFRLLISLLAFAVLFAYLKEGPLWGRLFLVGFALPLSLIVNSIRITLIAIVGEYMGSEAMHSFHDYSGYIVLVLAFIILSLVARLVRCRKFNSMLLS